MIKTERIRGNEGILKKEKGEAMEGLYKDFLSFMDKSIPIESLDEALLKEFFEKACEYYQDLFNTVNGNAVDIKQINAAFETIKDAYCRVKIIEMRQQNN
jgi:hypothetical protein